jgi:menaquinol-cytochrome c reductase iron-sulfur subunit
MAATACGAILAFFPFAVGLGVLIDPWRRGRRNADNGEPVAAEFTHVCSLDALSADGTPQAFPVVTKLVDAWTHAPNQRVGMIFLHRTGDENAPQVVAFSAECPHLGCFVDFNTADGNYECPCHESAFDKDGRKLFGPSLRGLDKLETKLEKSGDQTSVLVAFKKFQKGIAKQEAAG